MARQFSPGGPDAAHAGRPRRGTAAAATLLTMTCAAAALAAAPAYARDDDSGPSRPVPYEAPQTATTTGLASDPNPSRAGEEVVFSAKVTGSDPTGTVTFNNGGTPLCDDRPLDSEGVATCATRSLAPGSHGITATYGGDATNLPSTSDALTQTVRNADSELTAQRAVFRLSRLGTRLDVTGLSATLTSDGTPLAGQPVVFTDRSGRVPLCTATTDANGTADCDAVITRGPLHDVFLALELAAHGYRATFDGSADHGPATARGPVRPASR
ncbi:Ig-like domain-containing protein [Streptomyces sp. NPDC048664]|uniref:Ig-like domain-containing protein n=1 Tax=Streptomyces sp. NPDC048664 TaxID=3154505 RepID=UPI00341BD303